VRGLIVALATLGIGCAGTSSNLTVTELLPSDEPLFDHAVDLVEEPVVVRDQWGGTFESRVRRADSIAVVRVTSLSSDTVRNRSAYRLTAKVKNRLKGSSPREVVLRVQDDQRGYETVRANEDRLLEDPFVAFVKWGADPESDELIAHWHLSPSSDAVRENIDFFLRHPPREAQVTEP